jgi:hypothetical protein
MKLNQLRSTISGAALTLALVFGVMIASSASAQAQYRDYNGQYGSRQEWPRDRVRDYASKLGYHNAYTEAEREVRAGNRRANYRSMPGYRTDTNGYLSWMGHQDDYRDAYRRGYEQGFNDSLQGRSRRYDRNDVERVLGSDLERTYEGEPNYRDRDWDPRRNNRASDDNNRGRDDNWRGRDDNGRGGRNDIYRIAQQNGYNDGLRSGEEDRSRRRGSDYQRNSRYRDAISGYRSEYGNRDQYRQAYREGFSRGYEEGYRRNNRSNIRFQWPF